MRIAAKSIEELFGRAGLPDGALRTIRCTPIDAALLANGFAADMYVDATMIMIVTAGRMRMEINRRNTPVGPGCAVLLSASHLLRAVEWSDDFEGLCLAVGEEFMKDMDSVEMIYKRIRYGVKLFDKPVVPLASADVALLGERLTELRHAIGHTSHLYYREVVLNRLFAFYLDLSDIIDSRTEELAASERSARYESLVKRFIELLAANFRTEHKVGFYASQLNLSAHYLTLIVKEVTGRSVSDFIFGMLYSDARALLAESAMSVQEITTLLNFSDQSAFGKFFKRRSGLSPLDYRRKCNSVAE